MSYKRKKLYDENQQSSGVLDITGDLTTLISFNSEVGNDSVNVNLGGKAVIVDRTSNFAAKAGYAEWVPTFNIVSPSDNGNFIICVDNIGIPQIVDADGLSKLPAYDVSGIDMNNFAQLGVFSITAGSVTSGGSAIQWNGNLANRFMGLSDALGVINYFAERVRSDIVAGTLNLQILAGKVFSRIAGRVTAELTQRPDIIPVPDAPLSTVAVALRDNAIVSFGVTVDVLNYESPVGTLQVIPPNKAANRFCVIFPSSTFTGIQLGQKTYGTAALAQNSFEESEFSSITAGGFPTIQISLEKNETDLSNSLIKNLPRFL